MMETKQIFQEFECYIDSIDHDAKTFWAMLYDLTDPSVQEGLEEMAEFEFSVFHPDDHKYILEGLLFNIEFGHFVDANNVKTREFSNFIVQKRNRKEQAAFKKQLVKAKKEAKRMTLLIERMFD